MPAHYTIAIVDDHALVRRGIAETLEEDGAFTIVAEGGSAADSVRIARELAPDLILLDVNMPGGGIEAARTIHADSPGVRVAMFSFRQDLAIVRAALAAGARGYVVKGLSGPELIAFAHRILAGDISIDPELTQRLAASET